MKDNIFEATVGFQSKKAVVMIGRMNPPTLGHYKVIDSMKAFIRKNPEYSLKPIVVVINGAKTSEDTSKNPLIPEDRIKFMQASGKANGVTFIVAENAFAGFEAVRKLGYEPMAIAAGSDRAQKYKQMLDKYFTNDGETIEHVVLSGLERDEDADGAFDPNEKIDVSKVSGSMARAAVEAGYEDVFSKIVGLENKPKVAKIMFDKIKKAMGK